MPSIAGTLRSLGLTIGLAGVSAAGAQSPAYFAVLAVPPSAVGTCMPVSSVTTPPPGAEGALHGRRLVMTTRSPGGRRDITVFTDAKGQVRGYTESVHRTTTPGSSVGENVVAGVTKTGEVRGVHMRTSVAMQLPPDKRFDTLALRTMRERAKTTQESEPLGETAQAQVRTLAAWLLKRCAA